MVQGKEERVIQCNWRKINVMAFFQIKSHLEPFFSSPFFFPLLLEGHQFKRVFIAESRRNQFLQLCGGRPRREDSLSRTETITPSARFGSPRPRNRWNIIGIRACRRKKKRPFPDHFPDLLARTVGKRSLPISYLSPTAVNWESLFSTPFDSRIGFPESASLSHRAASCRHRLRRRRRRWPHERAIPSPIPVTEQQTAWRMINDRRRIAAPGRHHFPKKVALLPRGLNGEMEKLFPLLSSGTFRDWLNEFLTRPRKLNHRCYIGGNLWRVRRLNVCGVAVWQFFSARSVHLPPLPEVDQMYKY